MQRSLSWVGRMRISHRLLASFVLLLALTAALGGFALVGLSRVDTQAGILANKWLVGQGQLSNARAAMLESRALEVKHSRTDDNSYHAEYEDKMAEQAKIVAAEMKGYVASISTDEERAMTDKVTKAWDGYVVAQQKVVKLGRDNHQKDAQDISDGLAGMQIDESISSLDALRAYGFKQAQDASALVSATYARAKAITMALLGVALVLGLALAWALTRSLLRQLGGEPREAAAVAQAVTDGNLAVQVNLRPGDTDSLMARLAAMQQGLASAVKAVRQGSESVATASSQIAQGNQDLSSRTEQQASALQQTAATMDELGTTVRHNADNARQANQLAASASQVAARGGEVVGQVVSTMRGINDSSRKIADIIGTIDGIAFQTNILALNAAVEAARAGEQGRGFAVVAGEVRSLAQRSAEAAKEIKTLINASVERVSQGTSLVDEAGKTMEEIVASIKRVSDIVGEISSASVEQSTGVAEVGKSIAQMDQATQQNAALVEESAAAAESLRQQAEQLVQAVAVFRLAEAGRSGGRGVERSSVAPKAVTPAPIAAAAPVAQSAPKPYAGPERRGPSRATNVTRPSFGETRPAPIAAAPLEPLASRTGTDADWETF